MPKCADAFPRELYIFKQSVAKVCLSGRGSSVQIFGLWLAINRQKQLQQVSLRVFVRQSRQIQALEAAQAAGVELSAEVWRLRMQVGLTSLIMLRWTSDECAPLFGHGWPQSSLVPTLARRCCVLHVEAAPQC